MSRQADTIKHYQRLQKEVASLGLKLKIIENVLFDDIEYYFGIGGREFNTVDEIEIYLKGIRDERESKKKPVASRKN